MNFDITTLRLPGKKVVVTRPNERHYGHLGLEMVISLARARESKADVYFVRPSTRLGMGLFELESPDVRVLRPVPVVKELLGTAIWWRRFKNSFDQWRAQQREIVEREFVRETMSYVNNPGIPQEVREGLRDARRRFRKLIEKAARERRHRPAYYERRRLRTPVPVRLRPEAEAEAQRQALAVGIRPDAKLVCIHARESGYKRGNEIQDTKPENGRDDTTRNAKIETYTLAADELHARGYTVIRLGDPSMTPLNHPGVIDLATSPGRSSLLEVYCLLRCAFIIAGESAFVNLVYLTNTPILLVNATEPVSAYPVRAPGLFVTKTVIDKRDGRRLTNLDLLSPDYRRQFRDTRRYTYVDNSPEEIREATKEMLDWVEGRWVEADGQRRYHDDIMTAAAELARRSAYIRKWGLHEGFLGDGRIARVGLKTP